MLTFRTTGRRLAGRAGRSLRLGAVIAGCAVACLSASAQEAKQHELSDKTSSAIGTIKGLMQSNELIAANAVEILKTLDALLPTLDSKGYDYAYINQMKMNTLLRAGRHLEAIQPLEETIRYGFFPEAQTLEMRFYLASLYFQDANTSNDPAVRKAKLLKAKEHVYGYIVKCREPMLGAPEMKNYADAVLIYANTLYYLEDYKASTEQALRAVRMTVDPKDMTWVLLFASQQQDKNPEAAAETFELFIKKFPDRKDYWPQLAQAYLHGDQKLRAIFTYHRAQERGAMNRPDDYKNLFGLYYQLGEYSRAGELLREWMDAGKVPNNEENWELLSYCYQLLRREDQVRTILDEARKRFPTGNLDFQLAQYLWYDGKYTEGLGVAKEAWKKGGLLKPGRVALFLSTAFFEQRDLKEAEKFHDIAVKSGQCEKRDLDRVARYIRDAIMVEQRRDAEKIGAQVPSIATPPSSKLVSVGQSVTFSVVARSQIPMTFQWRKGGIKIDGATGDSYTIEKAQVSDNGDYSAIVTNILGSVSSSSGTLSVKPAAAP